MTTEGKNNSKLFRILDLLKEGVPSHEIQSRIYKEGLERGLLSEKKAQEAISELKIVKIVKKSSNEDDYFLKIDFFVHFRDGVKHTMVGVQVKSSEIALQNFMKSIEPDKRIIGICVRDGIHNKDIQKQFLSQLVRLDGEI